MSRIRGRNTLPETIVRARLRAAGVRGYRIQFSLPGRPDIVFPSAKLAIFVDGCFWHKCPIDYQEPETRRDFWAKKIRGNVDRDREVDKILTDGGWKVLRIWEHEIRSTPDSVVAAIAAYLEGVRSRQSESRS